MSAGPFCCSDVETEIGVCAIIAAGCVSISSAFIACGSCAGSSTAADGVLVDGAVCMIGGCEGVCLAAAALSWLYRNRSRS